MKRVIFVSGIHGVGKGYIFRTLFKRINFPVYTASDLIRKSNEISDINKKVDNINNNQSILLDAINKFVEEDIIVLDGHTCLFNSDGNVSKIPYETFESLNLVAVIFIHDDVCKVQERLFKRDNIKYDKNTLYHLQVNEMKYTSMISKKLKIPYLSFDANDDYNILCCFIEGLKL